MFININRTSNFSSLLKFHIHTVSTTISPSISEFLTHRHHFSPQAASQVASALKQHLKPPQNADSVLSFFKSNGFSTTQLEKTLKGNPRLLMSSLDNTIEPKLKFFRDLGLSSSEIAATISRYPNILTYSVNKKLMPSLIMMKDLLGSNERVLKVVKRFPSFLSTNLEKILLPNIDFLKSCGVSMEQITMVLYSHPKTLLYYPESISKWVAKVDEMGIDRSSKLFIHAVRVVSNFNDKSWELKLLAFKDLGISEDDIRIMFRKAPTCFSVSERKMKKIKEILLANGKYDLSSIINCPSSLGSSIDKRYKPRLRVLQTLETKNFITKWPAFATLAILTDEKFFQRYVGPYLSEVEDVYKASKE